MSETDAFENQRYLILTQAQYDQGYVEMVGGVVYHREYRLIQKRPKSKQMVVQNPEASYRSGVRHYEQ